MTVRLRKDGLKTGLHHAKISLVTPDALPFDNDKFVTFRVRQPRSVLALVDTPPGTFVDRAARRLGVAAGPAQTWKQVLDYVGWYDCDVRPVSEADRIDFTQYEQVTSSTCPGRRTPCGEGGGLPGPAAGT